MKHQWFSNINWQDVYEKKVECPWVPCLDNEFDLKYFALEDIYN